jgi:hypothetical protein
MNCTICAKETEKGTNYSNSIIQEVLCPQRSFTFILDGLK